MKVKSRKYIESKSAVHVAKGPIWMRDSLCFIHCWVIPLPVSSLWGNKKWDPQYKDQKLEKFQSKTCLTDC